MHAVTLSLLMVATTSTAIAQERTMRSSVSAYQLGVGRTATGRDVNLPGCATHWRDIPRGSTVTLPDGRTFLVDDAAGPKVPRSGVDIRCYASRAECLKWGRRRLTVTVRSGNGISRGKMRRQEPRIVHPGPPALNLYRISQTRQAPAIEPEAGGRSASALIGGICACIVSAGAMCLILGRRLRI